MIMCIDTDNFTLDDTVTLNKALMTAFESIQCGPDGCLKCEHYNTCVVLMQLHEWVNDKEDRVRLKHKDDRDG